MRRSGCLLELQLGWQRILREEDNSAKEKWQNMKTALRTTADSTLVYKKCRNLDWLVRV